ncbi:hypothetical protein [Paeniglutamicibacter kerguelensis]|uniref:Uncharacterized protein n=1 Tax=Paeniglutamicibacter kerguelensis TaxID=254788 RepID=A0ABS4XCV2_9MICC|nr:hypothetical protein [Paeniglutamicibacter kerguelensis]MBP2386223.1 hypothetical protein [Paeniglutamicibacter kerguelensis]
MSYHVTHHGGNREDRTSQTGYKILASGVLQIIHVPETGYSKVLFEYGPTGWLSVEGTRILDVTEVHQGSDGKIVNGTYHQEA